jgi:hypothetical protein
MRSARLEMIARVVSFSLAILASFVVLVCVRHFWRAREVIGVPTPEEPRTLRPQQLINTNDVLDKHLDKCEKAMMLMTHVGSRKSPTQAVVLRTPKVAWTIEDCWWLRESTKHHLRTSEARRQAGLDHPIVIVSDDEFRRLLLAIKPFVTSEQGGEVLSIGVVREIDEQRSVFEYFVTENGVWGYYNALLKALNVENQAAANVIRHQAGRIVGLID